MQGPYTTIRVRRAARDAIAHFAENNGVPAGTVIMALALVVSGQAKSENFAEVLVQARELELATDALERVRALERRVSPVAK